MKKLFNNGTVITMCDDKPHNALLVADGKIMAVGDDGMAGSIDSETEIIDLCGATIMPGFIDPHSHITQFAGAMRAVDLSGVKSITELVKKLETQKSEGWIVGFGYDNNRLEEKRHPLKTDLDAIQRPVLISHASGHMGVLNDLAMKELGISETENDPSGGVYGRTDGKLNGYMEENAFMAAAAQAPKPTIDEICGLMEQAQQVYFSYGVTTAQEGLMRDDEFEMLSKAKLKIDVVGYADMKDFAHLARQRRKYKNHFRVGGYKIFLDGSPQGRTAWLTKPYEKSDGQPDDYKGYPIYTDDQVAAFVKKANDEGIQLIAHCNGDAAIDQFISAHKAPTKNRDVIIHGQTMRLDQLPTVKEKGLMPSYFAAHTWNWGDAHIKNLGRGRAGLISPLKSTEDLGIPFTVHQDTPVLPPDMIDSLFCAVNRITAGGEKLSQSQAVDTFTALKAMTVYAAYQYFEEDQKGTLEPGKRADMVVLDKNPLNQKKENLREIKILATYKDGELVYKRE